MADGPQEFPKNDRAGIEAAPDIQRKDTLEQMYQRFEAPRPGEINSEDENTLQLSDMGGVKIDKRTLLKAGAGLTIGALATTVIIKHGEIFRQIQTLLNNFQERRAAEIWLGIEKDYNFRLGYAIAKPDSQNPWTFERLKMFEDMLAALPPRINNPNKNTTTRSIFLVGKKTQGVILPSYPQDIILLMDDFSPDDKIKAAQTFVRHALASGLIDIPFPKDPQNDATSNEQGWAETFSLSMMHIPLDKEGKVTFPSQDDLRAVGPKWTIHDAFNYRFGSIINQADPERQLMNAPRNTLSQDDQLRQDFLKYFWGEGADRIPMHDLLTYLTVNSFAPIYILGKERFTSVFRYFFSSEATNELYTVMGKIFADNKGKPIEYKPATTKDGIQKK